MAYVRLRAGIVAALLIGLWVAPGAPGLFAATGPANAEVGTAGEMTPAPSGAEAAEHHAATPNPLAFDVDLMVYTILVFLLLMAILGKFAWQPIIAAVDRRERLVAEQLATAQAEREAAARQLAEHQSKLAGAADEIRQMLDQARREAELQKQQIVAAAQSAAADEKKRALGEIAAAKNVALRELAERSVDSALGLAGKIVRRELQPGDHAELVQDALSSFPNQN